LLILAAITTSSESAFFSLNPQEKDRLKSENSKISGIILDLLSKPRELIALLLISINFVNVGIVILSTLILNKMMDGYSEVSKLLVEIFGITLLILITGEVIPKIYGANNASKVTRFMALPIDVIRRTPPISWLKSLLVNGTNFIGATGVTFGGTNATSFTVVSATQITAVTPVRVAGAVTVDVITPGGIARASDVFTFVAATPTVSSFTPNSGSTGGATSVVITGTNFIGTTGVSIGGVTATSFVVNSATQITAVAAAGTGSGAVTVTTAGGTGTSATAYSYLAPPVVTSLDVTTGSTAGGTTVVISGTGFTGTTSVTFGGTAAAIVSTTNNAITVTTPAKPAGAVTVIVTTSVSSASSATGAYTYATPPTP
jgi:hypothetical protein